MRPTIAVTSVLLLLADLSGGAFAQRVRRSSARQDTPRSVVVVPKSQQGTIDTALLFPKEEGAAGDMEQGTTRRRRKFQVKVVPAPPPGRSRQEILYSDSLGKVSP